MYRVKRKRVFEKDSIMDNLVNFAPFVDLLFTLIIVLLIPNQILFGNIKVDIPKGKAEIVVIKQDPITIYVRDDNTIFVNDEEIKINKIVEKIIELAMRDYSVQLFVVADKQVKYGRVISVIDILNSNNFTNVVLVTDLSSDLQKK